MQTSFAVEINSPLEKPIVSASDDGTYYKSTFGYVVYNDDGLSKLGSNFSNNNCILLLQDFSQEYSNLNTNPNYTYVIKSSGVGLGFKRSSSAQAPNNYTTATVSYIDVESGNLLSQRPANLTNLSGVSGVNTLSSSCAYDNMQLNTTYYDQGEFINPENTTVINLANSVFNTPFVNWSEPTPETPSQFQYKSPLSEPISDKYNVYAVLDDRLIWISYRINGIYSRSASIENISEIYSYNAQVTESGTGTYAGQQNGYTENIVIPSQTYSGTISGETEDITFTDSSSGYGGNYVGSDLGHSDPHYYQGAWYFANENLGNISFNGNHSGIISGSSLGNIDFSGVNTGNIHFNSNGTVSLKDIEYYPVSFNHNDIFEYYRLYCIPTDTDNFVFWLAPDRSFVPLASTNQLLVNMDFYYSEFDLEGNYIRSTFHTVTESDIGLFDAYQTEEPIHSVKFYGIDFFNVDNLPFNLSSVLWQYDFEFKQWRDNMFSKLSDIYNILSQSESLSSYQGKEFGSQLNKNNVIDELSYNSNSVDSNINSLLGQSIDRLGSDSGVLRSLTANIIALGNGKIFSLLIISLAAGVIILLLGKNKND